MIAQVLKHKTEKGNHGMILSANFYNTGTGIPPQLLGEHWNKDDLAKIIKNYFAAFDDYELVKINWDYVK